MYRSNSYNEIFSQNMLDSDFRKEYLLELLEGDEALELVDAIRFIATRMGTTEFANLVGESKQSIDKFIKGLRNPKRESLDKFLLPFNLKTQLTVQDVA